MNPLLRPPNAKTTKANPPTSEEEKAQLRSLDKELYEQILRVVRYDHKDDNEDEGWIHYVTREGFWDICYTGKTVPEGAYQKLELEPSPGDRADKYYRRNTEPWWFPGLERIERERLRYPLAWKQFQTGKGNTNGSLSQTNKQLPASAAFKTEAGSSQASIHSHAGRALETEQTEHTEQTEQTERQDPILQNTSGSGVDGVRRARSAASQLRAEIVQYRKLTRKQRRTERTRLQVSLAALAAASDDEGE